MSVRDKVKNKWYLLEGTVCQVGKIKEKTELKQEKYTELRAGIKDIYKECEVAQFNIVLEDIQPNTGGKPQHTDRRQERNTVSTSESPKLDSVTEH